LGKKYEKQQAKLMSYCLLGSLKVETSYYVLL